MAQGGLMYGAGFGISAFGVMNHRNGEIRLDIFVSMFALRFIKFFYIFIKLFWVLSLITTILLSRYSLVLRIRI